MSKQRLRFAPLIRVSTERQQDQGESLNTQRKQLEIAVKYIGGEIYRWYAGQEHATPDRDREIMARLMEDAKAKKFDAVIVADTSRWARDNQKNKEYLKILKANAIKFYVSNTEYDLFNPTHIFFLCVTGEINELHAKEQSYKSIINRIERARRGIPACGRKPYGRKFNKETGKWELDLEIKRKIAEIARLYLDENKSFEELGKQFGMNAPNLHKILTKRSGDKWEQEFQLKDCNIHEKIITTIPRLLPEATINRIKQRCQDRKTWAHGSQKYQYLFSRMIFDADTGNALSGTPNHGGTRYYRSYKNSGRKYMLNADVIERAVTECLFEAIGSNKKFYKAVFEDTPTVNEIDELKKQKKIYKKELNSLEKRIEHKAIIALKFNGTNLDVFVEKMKAEVGQLEEKRKKLLSEIQCIKSRIETIPTEEEVQEKREQFEEELKEAHKLHRLTSGHFFRELGFEEKRNIVQLIFGGKDYRGKRYGIYIKKVSDDKPKKYEFKAYGKLGAIVGLVKGKEYDAYDLEIYDADFQQYTDDVTNILGKEKIKEYMPSQCHAHHGLGLYQR